MELFINKKVNKRLILNNNVLTQVFIILYFIYLIYFFAVYIQHDNKKLSSVKKIAGTLEKQMFG
jgi:hypothetical protein